MCTYGEIRVQGVTYRFCSSIYFEQVSVNLAINNENIWLNGKYTCICLSVVVTSDRSSLMLKWKVVIFIFRWRCWMWIDKHTNILYSKTDCVCMCVSYVCSRYWSSDAVLQLAAVHFQSKVPWIPIQVETD